MDTVRGVSSINGILGSILSESPAVQRERLEAASIGAADLTNLIKRKAVTTTNEFKQDKTVTTLESNGKRRVGFAEEAIDIDERKKAKLSITDE